MSNPNNIPFVDLKSQLKDIRSEILQGFESVLNECNFILGKPVQEFETAFAKYCTTKYSIGVASGLDAIHLALEALNIGPGDEVIVQANTYIATALGVSMAGAKPVIVDADEKTFLMDMNKVKKAITSKTKAVLPVHLYGRMTELSELEELSKKHGFAIVEDAAQSHGSIDSKGRKSGAVGKAGCFSFYPGKNLGCYGDGGAIATNDEALKKQLEALRNYGSPQKYHHPIKGYNSRLDTIQATVLSTKLKRLDEYNRKRYEAAKKYNEALSGINDLVLPEIPKAGSHVFHLYVVRTERRDELVDFLNKNGVGSVIHYPTPIHLHGAYSELGHKKGDFPVAEKMSAQILSLPMFPELTDQQIETVAKQIKSFFKS